VPTTLEYLPQGRPRPVVIEVCQEAEDAVRTGALQRLRGLGDPMEGYDLLMQEKIGFALAVLDGRREVALEDGCGPSTYSTCHEPPGCGY
jgi:hypothetical protein